VDSVRRFKREIRRVKEHFLRFTHRYWFDEVSDQPLAKDLYHACRRHLCTEHLYRELREEIDDMSQYLDSDSLRRQANTVLRLTVVTILGMIGSVTTGFLGMNLIAEADAGLGARLLYFVLVFVPTVALTLFTVAKSRRLSDFLDALTDEQMPLGRKLATLREVWRG
jgi:Mg2+ and Co2+ transporter CorA